MGRIARSWDLMSQSFAILSSDKEMLLLPVISALFSLSISAIMLCLGALVFRPEIAEIIATRPKHVQMSPAMWVAWLLFYLANYFIAIFFNVALVRIASDRLNGGHASLNEGLQAAWDRKLKILEWACLAATVGMLLKALQERMGRFGRMLVSWIGIAWSLATFFVVPILAAEDLGPVEALERSADLFRQTWGEELVGNFSFGLLFSFLATPAIVLPIIGAKHGMQYAIAGGILMVMYWLMLGVVSSAVQGVFMAALYRYATTKQVPPGFNQADFAGAFRPKR